MLSGWNDPNGTITQPRGKARPVIGVVKRIYGIRPRRNLFVCCCVLSSTMLQPGHGCASKAGEMFYGSLIFTTLIASRIITFLYATIPDVHLRLPNESHSTEYANALAWLIDAWASERGGASFLTITQTLLPHCTEGGQEENSVKIPRQSYRKSVTIFIWKSFRLFIFFCSELLLQTYFPLHSLANWGHNRFMLGRSTQKQSSRCRTWCWRFIVFPFRIQSVFFILPGEFSSNFVSPSPSFGFNRPVGRAGKNLFLPENGKQPPEGKGCQCGKIIKNRENINKYLTAIVHC